MRCARHPCALSTPADRGPARRRRRATPRKLQRISTIYVGWKKRSRAPSPGAELEYMCDVDGWFAAASEDQERGRLPSNRGIGGTGESFSGEHGLRVRALVSAVNAAKEDDKLRVCSGVSIWRRNGAHRQSFGRLRGVRGLPSRARDNIAYKKPQRTPRPLEERKRRPFWFNRRRRGPRGARQHRIARPPLT